MGKIINKIDTFTNKHFGVIGLLTLIATILVPYLVNISANSINKYFSIIKNILVFTFPVAVYQLVLLVFFGLIYFNRIRKKYRIQVISKKLLVGAWKNEWKSSTPGSENLRINPEMKYSVNETLFFNIRDFDYDPQKNKIKFFKVGAREDNKSRRLLNTLTIQNNDTLEGTEIEYPKEIEYPIKYTRISD